MLMGGMMGYGLGRSRFGGGGGFGGGSNYKTAMMMSSLPSIGRQVSHQNGYANMKGNIAPNYGYGNSYSGYGNNRG